MGKVERHRADLEPLLMDFLATEDRQAICEYLEQNSNLPGRRVFLELARAFGDVVADAASFFDAPFATVISSGVFEVERSQAVGRARFLDFALRCALGYARNDGVSSDLVERPLAGCLDRTYVLS